MLLPVYQPRIYKPSPEGGGGKTTTKSFAATAPWSWRERVYSPKFDAFFSPTVYSPTQKCKPSIPQQRSFLFPNKEITSVLFPNKRAFHSPTISILFPNTNKFIFQQPFYFPTGSILFPNREHSIPQLGAFYSPTGSILFPNREHSIPQHLTKTVY